ncbi:hypothetical protein PPACK8108_LOCUS17303 [Phakopsora pachyrhizi]|uniref:Uncharacterized protein n=1 Tax=Phakopsora pachyrhizi TaxID=170000 RepID=A0AAV0BE86_PHAPC|nr:hypothetical protein PPACK8108_LOCUS17303 [Phakopsora pachyrhizi]
MPPDWIFTNVKNPPDIGPPPSTHSNSPPDGTNGFTEVHQYKTPYEHAYGYEHPIPEADCDVEEDVNKILPRAQIRHVVGPKLTTSYKEKQTGRDG